MTVRRSSFAARPVRANELRRAITPQRAAVLVVAGLVLASLLTAPALLATAERQPYGPARTAMVTVAQGIADVSAAARLDVPWRTLDAWVHPTEESGLAKVVAAPVAPTAPTAPPASTREPQVPAPAPAAPAPAPTPDPAEKEAPTPAPAEAPTSSPTTPVAPETRVATGRVPTPDDPLRVWIAGDSMWERPGPKLVEALRATGVVDVLDLEVRYSTGLTRPDYFDWPAHAAARVASLDPELVLFVIGPNDSQPLVQDGIRHAPRTEGFDAAYAARAHRMMELLAADGRQVLWVGLPPMRDDGFDQRMRDLDAAYAAAAAALPGAQHVPTRALFSDAGGAYAEYLPGPDGSLQPMRNRDGVHLSDDGARRLAVHLFDLLDSRHGLSD